MNTFNFNDYAAYATVLLKLQNKGVILSPFEVIDSGEDVDNNAGFVVYGNPAEILMLEHELESTPIDDGSLASWGFTVDEAVRRRTQIEELRESIDNQFCSKTYATKQEADEVKTELDKAFRTFIRAANFINKVARESEIERLLNLADHLKEQNE